MLDVMFCMFGFSSIRDSFSKDSQNNDFKFSRSSLLFRNKKMKILLTIVAVITFLFVLFYNFLKTQFFNGTFADNTVVLEETFKKRENITDGQESQRMKQLRGIKSSEERLRSGAIAHFWDNNNCDDNRDKTLILAFHGQWGIDFKALDRCGFIDVESNKNCEKVSVASVTYRGYDVKNDDSYFVKLKKFFDISEKSIYADAEALVDRAYEKGYRNVLIYGFSLGGAASTHAAQYVANYKNETGPENNWSINLEGIILDTVICGTERSAKHILEFKTCNSNHFIKNLAKFGGSLLGKFSSIFWKLDPVENLEKMPKDMKKKVPILYITGDKKKDFFNYNITELGSILKENGFNIVGVVEAKGREHGDQKGIEKIVSINEKGKVSFIKPKSHDNNFLEVIYWKKDPK